MLRLSLIIQVVSMPGPAQTSLYSRYLLLLLLIISGSLGAVTGGLPMVVRYPDEGTVWPTYLYRYELIKQILETTRSEYGDYRLEPYRAKDPGVKRQAMLISEGDQINLLWASPGTAIANANVIPIPVDILKGTLSSRICLTNRMSRSKLNAVTDIKTLKNIRIGQGAGWADVEIYTFNKIPTVLSSSFAGLFGMLATNRFECIAFGIDEINYIYSEKTQEMPMLEIDKTFLIYYDFPVHFYVSAKYPELAERFKKGMLKLQMNGEFDRLFDHFYQDKLKGLNLNARRVICLKSPFVPLEKQCLHNL